MSIHFITPSILPIEAAITMGVSVKAEGSIGKFGTGLKYAIAGILRLQGEISIAIDGENYQFSAVPTDIRGKTFEIVHCNGAPCGFTTELGKHWEPWQLFRELASNTLDENGHWTSESANGEAGMTIIRISCPVVENAAEAEQVFLDRKRTVLVSSSNGATIYEGASQHYYYKGIRAGSFGMTAPVTIDVSDGTLSEDRLLDMARVKTETAWAFRTATDFSSDLLDSVINSDQPGMFWFDAIQIGMVDELPPSVLTHIESRAKTTRHPAFRRALDRHRAANVGRFLQTPMTDRFLALLAAGEGLARTVGIDVIPRDKVRYTAEMPDGTLAVTDMNTREVWFSTTIAMSGRDEFLSCYVEEALHAMTGADDCSRRFQNILLALVVSLGLARPDMKEAA